jgi:hypothetical protein
VTGATSRSDAIVRWVHDEVYGRPWSPRPPEDTAGFVEALERLRRESRERLANLSPADPASPRVRGERAAIYFYACGLAALGRVDALPDVFDHWHATSPGSELWRLAAFLTEGLPLPRRPDGVPDLAPAAEWVSAHVGEIVWDEQSRRFAMRSQ